MKIVLFALLITSLGTVGCASGGGEEPDAGGVVRDSGNLSDRVTSLVDAARDGAAVIRDASYIDVTLPSIDSAIVIPDGGGIFCTTSAQCTTAGTCCFSLGGMGLCIPGTEPIPGVCLPN